MLCGSKVSKMKLLESNLEIRATEPVEVHGHRRFECLLEGP